MHASISAPRETVCFRVGNRTYSVTGIKGAVVTASPTRARRRLRGRPRTFRLADIQGGFFVASIVRRGRRLVG